MLDAKAFIQLVKKAAVDAVADGRPCDILSCRVVSTSPLTVRLATGVDISAPLLVCVGGGYSEGDNAAVLRQAGGRRYFLMGVIAS